MTNAERLTGVRNGFVGLFRPNGCCRCFGMGLAIYLRMKEIIHTDYDGKACPTYDCDCMLGNLGASIVRSGDEPFRSYYAVEWGVVAFWTMFPKGLSNFLSLPYLRFQEFNNPHGDVVRVLNNPGFYKDANAPERR